MAMAAPFRPFIIPSLLLLATAATLLAPTASSARPRKLVLRYYSHQQLNVNVFSILPAVVPAVNGTRQGVGVAVVNNYDISKGPNASTSATLGFIRGTSIVVSNTVNATVWAVNSVVHYNDPSVGLNGTFTTQGEADFGSGQNWENAVTGGTGVFRNAVGYAVGRVYSFTPATANATAKVINFYKTHLWLAHL